MLYTVGTNFTTMSNSLPHPFSLSLALYRPTIPFPLQSSRPPRYHQTTGGWRLLFLFSLFFFRQMLFAFLLFFACSAVLNMWRISITIFDLRVCTRGARYEPALHLHIHSAYIRIHAELTVYTYTVCFVIITAYTYITLLQDNLCTSTIALSTNIKFT